MAAEMPRDTPPMSELAGDWTASYKTPFYQWEPDADLFEQRYITLCALRYLEPLLGLKEISLSHQKQPGHISSRNTRARAVPNSS